MATSDAADVFVLRNANVVTMDDARPAAQAVAIRGGRILAVGSNAEADGWIDGQARVRDLGGRTLLPGFYDSHNHMLMTGLGLLALDLSAARSVDDVLAAVAGRAARQPAGTWIVGSPRWHESQLVEDRFPRRDELDRVAPGHPVLLRRGGHNLVVNSAAFQRAGITRETPNPPGGTYVRDPDSGELTGHVIGTTAHAPILAQLPPTTQEDRLAALRAVLARYRAAGLTSVVEPGLQPPDLQVLRSLADAGELTARTSAMWRIGLGATDESLTRSIETLRSGAVTIERHDPWLRTQAIKLGADGGVETGYHRQPYAYADDPQFPRGKPFLSAETLTRFGVEAARLGWQVGVHCVGDAAIDLVLDAFEAVEREVSIRDLRWTIIHMMAAQPEHFARANALRLAITAQQPLQYSLAAGFVRYLGPERARNIEPLRLYLERSATPVGGGSDSPVTPFEPLVGIWSSVTRSTELAGVQGPEWAITAELALRMYTLNSAWCAFEEDVKGSITPGKFADLVVLSDDPRRVEPDAIKDVRVEMTVVDGKVVHEA